MATIKIEGQTIKGNAENGITDEIANDDELLKAYLVSTWPDVRTATFKREGGKNGKELVVTVQKRAGTKGMDDSEIEEQRRHDRREAEADRVRKLESIALAVDAFLLVHYEFADQPLDNYAAAITAHVEALDKKCEELGGEEIQKIKDERRGA